MSRVWTVKTLTLEVQRALDRFFPNIEVEGEVAQLTTPGSGHCYLTLREGDATLGGVMWKSHWGASRFRPKVGDRVKCRGKLGYFPSQSKLQIYIRTLEPAGQGWLQQQIEERIGRLRADGLLDPSRKRPLPAFPRTVGVATSGDGAALQDFLRVSRQRFPAARILLAPCKVQGPEAAASVTRALALLAEHGGCDVVVVTRGGGSKEDLLPFMDELLARQVARMPMPVVSAVGHEVDTSICDMVADAVAPTPSAAAMTVLPDVMDLARRVDEAAGALTSAALRVVRRERSRVDALRARLRHPADRLKRDRRDLESLEGRLHRALEVRVRRDRARLSALDARLAGLSPLAVLDRGYAIALREGHVVTAPDQVAAGDRLELRLAGGTVTVRVEAG
ncbi:MAG: exodeoxyribonuclease VII large subunit [Myxococcota bacterium]